MKPRHHCTRTIAALIAATLALAGCGSTSRGASSSHPQATTSTSDGCHFACGTTYPSGSTAPTDTTDPDAARAYSGLVFDTTCTNQTSPETITFLDPDTGTRRANRVFTHPDTAPTAFPASPGGTPEHPVSPVQVREIFNHDYSRMAVTETTPDGGTHIGYLTSGTAAFTDLTQATGGFASAPRDTDPVFQPGTDTLWYLTGDPSQDSTLPLSSIDTTTPDTQPVSHGSVHDGPVLISTTGRVLTPRSAAPASWSSDQTFAAPDGSALLHYNNEGGFLLETGGHATSYQEPAADGSNTCTPTGFISATVILCDNATTITLTGHTATKTSLIPATDRTNFDAILSPDHDTIAFESLQGQTAQLYEVSANGGTPTLINVDPATYGELVGWQ